MTRSGLLGLAGCLLAGIAGFPSEGTPPRIRVSPTGPVFLCPKGQPFHPWGFNYDRDHRGRLLEEYWEREWDTVAADLAEMKRLGANTVRIHLQVAAFLKGPGEPDAAALRRLRRLLRLAERTGLFVDLTGLACYRRTAVPGWYDALSESDRWRAQATFWRAVARTARSSSAVFCYNLMNEPFVPAQPRPAGDWLAGEFGGFSYVQAVTRDPRGRPRATVARDWVRLLKQSIRAEDPQALVTVGLLPERRRTNSFSGFEPELMSRELDFLSVHLYPDEKRLSEAMEVLDACRSDKPLVVEEIFPLHIRAENLIRFMQEHSDQVAGWLTFYWGQPPEELAAEGTFAGAILHDWLVRWQLMKPPWPR